jgi:hypothetical protein
MTEECQRLGAQIEAQERLMRIFCRSAWILLLITGMAKIISAFGSARALQKVDPILRLDYRHILWLVAGAEITIAAICALSHRTRLKLWLIAWLATNFLLYRVAAICVGVHICPCLGSLTQGLLIHPTVANVLMWGILAYLLFGSYLAILSLSITRRQWHELEELVAFASIPRFGNQPSPSRIVNYATLTQQRQWRARRLVLSCVCAMSIIILLNLLVAIAKPGNEPLGEHFDSQPVLPVQ